MLCAGIVLQSVEFFAQMSVNSVCLQHCRQKFAICIQSVSVQLYILHWLYSPGSVGVPLVRA